MIDFADARQRLYFSRNRNELTSNIWLKQRPQCINAFRCFLIGPIKLSLDRLVLVADDCTEITGTVFDLTKNFLGISLTAFYITIIGTALHACTVSYTTIYQIILQLDEECTKHCLEPQEIMSHPVMHVLWPPVFLRKEWSTPATEQQIMKKCSYFPITFLFHVAWRDAWPTQVLYSRRFNRAHLVGIRCSLGFEMGKSRLVSRIFVEAPEAALVTGAIHYQTGSGPGIY